MAKLVAPLLAMAALWFRIQPFRKNTNGRHKQSSEQHTLATPPPNKKSFKGGLLSFPYFLLVLRMLLAHPALLWLCYCTYWQILSLLLPMTKLFEEKKIFWGHIFAFLQTYKPNAHETAPKIRLPNVLHIFLGLY